MNRAELLTAALEAVNARPKAYGPPEDNFNRIADLWFAYIGGKYQESPPFNAVDVAAMMALMKIARLEETPDHMDSWTDLAGYAACGAECASVIEHDPEEHIKAPDDVDVTANAGDAPRFKPGDKVRILPSITEVYIPEFLAGKVGTVARWHAPKVRFNDWEYEVEVDGLFGGPFYAREKDLELAPAEPRFKPGDRVRAGVLGVVTVARLHSKGGYVLANDRGALYGQDCPYRECELTPAV